MILDLDSLDPKTQQILSRFDMLVVGRYEKCKPQSIKLSDYQSQDDDEEMAFEEESSYEVLAC